MRDDSTHRFRANPSICRIETGTDEDARLSAECDTIRAALPTIDVFFRSLGRDGWSDTGLAPDIGVDEPYTVVFEARHETNAFFSRIGMRDPRIMQGIVFGVTAVDGATGELLDSVDLRPAVSTTTGGVNESTLTHEFGHGIFAIELGRSVTAGSAGDIGGLNEHVADMFAILEDGHYGRSLDEQLVFEGRNDDGTFFAVRDHRTGTAYADNSCLERPHTDNLLLPARESHRESCLFTRIWALERETDGTAESITYHGVEVTPFADAATTSSFAETKSLFYDMLRAHLTSSTTYAEYGSVYAAALRSRMALCMRSGTCREGYTAHYMRPYWATGLWGVPSNLGRDSVVGPAAAARAGNVWLFFVPPGGSGSIEVLRSDDLFAGSGSIDTLASLGVSAPATDSDLAAARTGDLVSLAIIPTGGNIVSVASTVSSTDPTWRSTTLDVPVPGVRTGVGTVSVVHADSLPLPVRTVPVVVATRDVAGTSELAYFVVNGTTPTVLPVPGSSGEHSPSLSRGSALETVLYSVSGSDIVRRDLSVNGTVVTWGSRVVAAANAVASMRGGLLAHSFLGRTQLFYPRLGSAGHVDLAHRSTGEELVPGPAWPRRPAVFETIAEGIPTEVVISFAAMPLGMPETPLIVAQRRSD